MPTVGISLFQRDASSHYLGDRKANATTLIPPMWDRWFDEELAYAPATGALRYSIDNEPRLSFNVDPLPPGVHSIALRLTTWGWYKGGTSSGQRCSP